MAVAHIHPISMKMIPKSHQIIATAIIFSVSAVNGKLSSVVNGKMESSVSVVSGNLSSVHPNTIKRDELGQPWHSLRKQSFREEERNGLVNSHDFSRAKRERRKEERGRREDECWSRMCWGGPFRSQGGLQEEPSVTYLQAKLEKRERLCFPKCTLIAQQSDCLFWVLSFWTFSPCANKNVLYFKS